MSVPLLTHCGVRATEKAVQEQVGFRVSATLAVVVSRFEHMRNGHSSSVNFLAMRNTGV